MQKRMKDFEDYQENQAHLDEAIFKHDIQRMPIKRRFITPASHRKNLKTQFVEEFYNKERKHEVMKSSMDTKNKTIQQP